MHHRYSRVLLTFFILLGWSSCSSSPKEVAVPFSPEPTIEVSTQVEIDSRLSQKQEWQDLKIGFGMSQLLIEEIYQSGRFRLNTKPDYRASIQVLDHYRNRAKAGIGLAHTQKITTILEVQITLVHIATGQTWKSQGEGQAQTQAGSFLFSFKEGSKQFAQDEVSLATQAAIKQAWTNFKFQPSTPKNQ